MNPKLRSLAILFILVALALVNLASGNLAPVSQDLTATPTATSLPGVIEQPEVTNGIAFLGILIFAVIVLAVAIRLRELHPAEPEK